MKITDSDTYSWAMGRRYLNRVEPLQGNATTIFLKPAPLHGPNQPVVLAALRRFGFEVRGCGTKAFHALELRAMWRNLRDWGLWRENAHAYNSVSCPVYRIAYPHGNTLEALDFFKRETRKRFSGEGEQTRNYLHAPENAFEAILHSRIMLGAVKLPGLRHGELERLLKRALDYVAEYKGRPDFFIVNSLLSDRRQRILAKGLFGLCAVTLGKEGLIEEIRYLRQDAWVTTLPDRFPPFLKLYRILYDSTFLAGSRTKFIECLACYEHLFLRKTFEDFQRFSATGDSSGTASGNLLLAALLPPFVGRSKLNDADSAAANELLRLRSANVFPKRYPTDCGR